MQSSVVIMSNYDPKYLEIVCHLAEKELAAGTQPTIFDLSALSATPVDSYHRKILTSFGYRYPGHDIENRLTRLGARYVRVQAPKDCEKTVQLGESLEKDLMISVRSALITFFRTDKPQLARRFVRKTEKALLAEGRESFRAVTRYLDTHKNVTRAYLPNGRFPHQKMASLAFATRNIDCFHYEKGMTEDQLYVRDYAPQNRIKSQASVTKTLENLSRQEIDSLADAWLKSRVPSRDSLNEFSSLWNHKVPEHLKKLRDSGKKIACFFTSSQDEFQFLGKEWHLHSWESQFDAFDQLLTKVTQLGYHPVLRVHPNLASKAHDCFLRERNDVIRLAEKHPEMTIFWHDDEINSYSLVQLSDLIVVWYSTIGLEASAMGKSVITTAVSRYGLVADIREVLGTEQLERLNLTQWRVDSHQAKRFISYLLTRDEKLSTSEHSWLTWKTKKVPLGVKLAAIAVSGGTPSPLAAFGSLVDTYRHRSITANLNFLKNRVKRKN